MKKIFLAVLFLAVNTSAATAQETIGFSDPAATHHLNNYRLPSWQYNLFFPGF